jgi:hypothetical protein
LPSSTSAVGLIAPVVSFSVVVLRRGLVAITSTSKDQFQGACTGRKYMKGNVKNPGKDVRLFVIISTAVWEEDKRWLKPRT